MWLKREYLREITPEEVKKLPVGTRVYLQWEGRYGELIQIDAEVALRNGKPMIRYLSYTDGLMWMNIRNYKGRKWLIEKGSTEGE